MSFYAVYACPTHPAHEIRGFFGPPEPRWCGWVHPAEPLPCASRLDIVRWAYDPAEADPKASNVRTASRLAIFVMAVLGVWAVIAFGALCIYLATRGHG